MEQKTRGFGGRFEVSEKGILLENNNLIPRDRIHRLVLRNSISAIEIPYSSGMVVGGTGMVGAGMAVGSAIGNAMSAAVVAAANAQRQRKAAIGYRLDVEHGGVATTLAGGMSETTAYGLMSDIGKIIE